MIDQVCLNSSLLDAAKEVFETMIFMDIEEVAASEDQFQGDTLLSSITFTGEIEGCLAICCTKACSRTIAINMLGMDTDDDITDEDICDAIGEVANMLIGGVKSRMAENIGEIQVSIPSVVSGRQLENNMGSGATKIVVTVNIQDEGLLELSLLYRSPSS